MLSNTLGGAAAAWPRAVRAQQARRVMRVGFFGPALTASSTIAPYQAFLAQLRDASGLLCRAFAFRTIGNDAGQIDGIAVDHHLAHTWSGLVTFDLHC